AKTALFRIVIRALSLCVCRFCRYNVGRRILHFSGGRKRMRRAPMVAVVAAVSIVLALSNLETAAPQKDPAARTVLDQYCITCHNEKLRTAGLALDKLDVTHPNSNADTWERVIEKLRAGSMPPPGRPRPDTATYRAVATGLENEIDRAWAVNPNPGRIG